MPPRGRFRRTEREWWPDGLIPPLLRAVVLINPLRRPPLACVQNTHTYIMQTQANRSRRVTSNFDFSSGRRIRKKHSRHPSRRGKNRNMEQQIGLSLASALYIIKKPGSLSTLPLYTYVFVCIYILQSPVVVYWYFSLSLSLLSTSHFLWAHISSSFKLERPLFYGIDRFLISLSLSLR